ncbi:MAG: dihydropteroate synthase [Weeksellaceae bacterium]|nr:dihydropteroate synthase [Weeksellaceae bacterium]
MRINCKGKLIDLSEPKIMGILNATPDSFYEGSRLKTLDAALKKAEEMLKFGADFLDVGGMSTSYGVRKAHDTIRDFLDVGGMSTRPDSDEVSEEEELKRVVLLIEKISREFPESLISIDTYRSKVAKESVEAGAAIVNDISAGSLDENMFKTVAKLQVPYILMHMQGTPKNMQKNPVYEDVVLEINHFFSQKINELYALGVNDIILDPGFGFGKTVEHNYQLLANLDLIGEGRLPILAGVSRKSMIYNVLNISPSESLNGTTVVNTLALQKGAAILRVHDVKEAKEVTQLWLSFIAI